MQISVTVSGTIRSFGGTCPALSLVVGTTYVRTNSATTFTGKGCGDLKKGDTVGVAGTKQSDGIVVLATTIAAGQ